MSDTRCWISPRGYGYVWKIRWPNGGAITGTEATWRQAVDRLHGHLNDAAASTTAIAPRQPAVPDTRKEPS